MESSNELSPMILPSSVPPSQKDDEAVSLDGRQRSSMNVVGEEGKGVGGREAGEKISLQERFYVWMVIIHYLKMFDFIRGFFHIL